MLHRNARDLTGLKVGMLTVLRNNGRTSDGHLAWDCLCECGKQKLISSNSLVRKNPVKSCGCMNAITARVKLKSLSWNKDKTYTIRNGGHEYATRHAWANAAIRVFGNKCEICGWCAARCDVHHKISRCDGGTHTLGNAQVLCPNHHREIHEISITV